LETKSFVIDYVNLSDFTTKSTKNINVGASASINNSDNSSDSDSNNNNNNLDANSNSDSTTVISSSEFKFWTNLSDEINEILSRDGDYSVVSKSIINKEAGVVTITGTSDQVRRVDKYLKKLKDRLHKQVLLEAKLIEVSYTDIKSKGIDWSKFKLSINGEANTNSWATLVDNITNSGGSSDVSIAYNFSMSGLLDFLDSYGDVNVLSTPKIMTLNNQPAVINVGDQINYQYLTNSVTTYNNGTPQTDKNYGSGSTFIGLTLNIVPEITENGYVVLRINPVVSDMIGEYDSSVQSAPDIRIKQLSSIVKAKNGSRVVVGGLVSHSKTMKENKVQLLGDVPVLGYAFRNETSTIIKKELIIVITPTIVDYNKFPSISSIEASMRELEYE
jgi:general secretion pathway protein D